MPEYRLFSTRRHQDGSFETPSVVLTLQAPNSQAAIAAAGRHSFEMFGEAVDVAWLTDPDGAVLWTAEVNLPEAA